ncbi:unnamed protein product, partial [Owenia fusiformis]
CTDNDECAQGSTNNCDSNAMCMNTEGSFSCNCNPGYTGNGTLCQPTTTTAPTSTTPAPVPTTPQLCPRSDISSSSKEIREGRKCAEVKRGRVKCKKGVCEDDTSCICDPPKKDKSKCYCRLTTPPATITTTAAPLQCPRSDRSSSSKEIREGRKCAEVRGGRAKCKKGACEDGTSCMCDPQMGDKSKCYCRSLEPELERISEWRRRGRWGNSNRRGRWGNSNRRGRWRSSNRRGRWRNSNRSRG